MNPRAMTLASLADTVPGHCRRRSHAANANETVKALWSRGGVSCCGAGVTMTLPFASLPSAMPARAFATGLGSAFGPLLS